MIDRTKQAQILHDLYISYGTDADWVEWFDLHDLGVPLAVVLTQGLVTPAGVTDAGWSWINIDYESVLEYLGLDPYAEFDDVDQMLEVAGYEQG